MILRRENGFRLISRVREVDVPQRNLTDIVVVPSAEVVNAVGLVGHDGIRGELRVVVHPAPAKDAFGDIHRIDHRPSAIHRGDVIGHTNLRGIHGRRTAEAALGRIVKSLEVFLGELLRIILGPDLHLLAIVRIIGQGACFVLKNLRLPGPVEELEHHGASRCIRDLKVSRDVDRAEHAGFRPGPRVRFDQHDGFIHRLGISEQERNKVGDRPCVGPGFCVLAFREPQRAGRQAVLIQAIAERTFETDTDKTVLRFELSGVMSEGNPRDLAVQVAGPFQGAANEGVLLVIEEPKPWQAWRLAGAAAKTAAAKMGINLNFIGDITNTLAGSCHASAVFLAHPRSCYTQRHK